MKSYLGSLWCRFFHSHISRPYYGQYTCLVCLRRFEAGWGHYRPSESDDREGEEQIAA